MLHTPTLPRRMGRRDTSVPLLRTRIPRFVLQEGHCSVYAAGEFPPARRQLCVVNVKLTMWLGIGWELLVSARCNSRRFSPGGWRGCYTGCVKQFGRCAGRGGDVARALREKISTNEGGLSQSPPFCFGPRVVRPLNLKMKGSTPRLGASPGPAPDAHSLAAGAPSEPAGTAPQRPSYTIAPAPSACPCSTCPDSSTPTCFRTRPLSSCRA